MPDSWLQRKPKRNNSKEMKTFIVLYAAGDWGLGLHGYVPEERYPSDQFSHISIHERQHFIKLLHQVTMTPQAEQWTSQTNTTKEFFCSKQQLWALMCHHSAEIMKQLREALSHLESTQTCWNLLLITDEGQKGQAKNCKLTIFSKESTVKPAKVWLVFVSTSK